MEVWIKYGTTNYSVSNTGKVMNHKTGRILKTFIIKGYRCINLSIKGDYKPYTIRSLVAQLFLGYDPSSDLVVKYKDYNTRSDSADNLLIVTKRESCDRKHIPHTSVYTGVHWYTRDECWHATITVDGGSKHLGYFEDEEEAHKAYEEELLRINKQQKR